MDQNLEKKDAFYPAMDQVPSQNSIQATPELEVRDVQEAGPNDTLVTTRYVVHKVRPLSDTLFKISYHYKISIKEIQRVNKFTGEDIFFMKEMLIPYKGDLSNCKAPKIDIKQEEADEKKRREACVTILANLILREEKKWQQHKKLLDNKVHLSSNDFKTEAIFYLEENQYDFNQSVKNYKQDLNAELELVEEKKREKKNKGKKKTSKVGN